VLYERLLRLGVIIRPTPIERAVRISIGLPEENDRLLAALPEALAVEG
jgi:histidinol-phosphate aminotransferase